jgi:hypothetical protein
VDRELVPNFAVSTTFTFRRMQDMLWAPLIGVRQKDYTQSGTLSGTLPELGAYNVPIYALNASKVPPGGGKEASNHDGYHQRFMGLEFSATKRMANRWMARFGFSTNDWREYYDNPDTAIVDPTRAAATSTVLTGARPFAGPQFDGGLVVRQAAGSGKSGIYMVAPRYQLTANGMYEGPWGLNLGANLVTRQGYSEPFFRSQTATGDPLGRTTVLLVNDVAQFRLPTVSSLDGRVSKKFTFGKASASLDFDVFNIFNRGTVLGKQYDARLTGATGFGNVLEIMNPRIARLGARFTF